MREKIERLLHEAVTGGSYQARRAAADAVLAELDAPPLVVRGVEMDPDELVLGPVTVEVESAGSSVDLVNPLGPIDAVLDSEGPIDEPADDAEIAEE